MPGSDQLPEPCPASKAVAAVEAVEAVAVEAVEAVVVEAADQPDVLEVSDLHTQR